MYVCTYTYLDNVCVSVCMNVCLYVYVEKICVSVCLNACLYVCISSQSMYVCMSICLYVCMYVCKQTGRHTYIYIYIYIFILFIYIYIHTHTYCQLNFMKSSFTSPIASPWSRLVWPIPLGSRDICQASLHQGQALGGLGCCFLTGYPPHF